MSGQVEDTRAPVPANFIAEMERTGLTNAEVARGLGVSERQITRWRGGQIPGYEFVVRMGRYFGRDPGWFYTTDHDPDEQAAA